MLATMCGRFALYTEPVKVARFLQAMLDGVKDDWQPSWNIPPITTSDNPDMHEIHNRMPVILEKSTWEEWVNPGDRGP